MKVNIRVDFNKTNLPIRNVAQILNSFALICEGLNFMRSGDVYELGQRLSSSITDTVNKFPAGNPLWDNYRYMFVEQRYYPDELIKWFYELGRGIFESKEPLSLDRLPGTIQDLPLQSLLKSMYSENTPELASVRKGSLEAEIEKLLDWMSKIFGEVVSSPTVLPPERRTNNGRELRFILDDLASESRNESSRYFGSGLTTTGAAMLAVNYRELDVTYVSVQATDDDGRPAYL